MISAIGSDSSALSTFIMNGPALSTDYAATISAASSDAAISEAATSEAASSEAAATEASPSEAACDATENKENTDSTALAAPKLANINFGTPTKITKITDLKKRHLDHVGASDSPNKNMKQVPYGEHELSQEAIQYKLDNDITTGRNVAVAEFESPVSKKKRRIKVSTQGPPGTCPHSELTALAMTGEKAQRVFSDRKPCRLCHRKIKLAHPDVEVLYSADYSDDRAEQRSNEQKFRKLQAASYGIREPNSK